MGLFASRLVAHFGVQRMLEEWVSKGGSRIDSINVIWQLVRDTDSWATSLTH